MHEHIAAELRWRLRRWPETTRGLRNACVGLQHHYMDALMREMGLAPKVPGVRAADARDAPRRLRAAPRPRRALRDLLSCRISTAT